MRNSQAVVQPNIRSWSTKDYDPAQRLDYWIGAICEAFLEMDCSSTQGQSFEGKLTHLPIGEIALNQVVASTSDVYRTAQAISRSKAQPLYLITNLDSAWQVVQGGRSFGLEAGDLALIDSAQCYEFHFPDSVRNMSVQLPRDWVARWLNQVNSLHPRIIKKDIGWGAALSGLCSQFAVNPTLAFGYPEQLLVDQFGATLGAAVEPVGSQPCSSVSAPLASIDLVKRALGLTQQRLGQADLNASDIACELGVSARTLHRHFAASQQSFLTALRLQRMQLAAQLLMQPRFASLDIAAIGRRCGVVDASHFVREFQRVHGLTPARWRRARLQ
jgi:AraC family transcriptional regulator, positive regulator of tynA and feaB